MRKYMEEYTEEVLPKLKGKVTKEDLEELKLKITYFQHERLIHLLVTIAFAIFTVIFLCLGMISYVFLIPFASFIIFLIFYILHYFFLENHVQYLYRLYDEMQAKLKDGN